MVERNGSMGAAEQGCALTSSSLSSPVLHMLVLGLVAMNVARLLPIACIFNHGRCIVVNFLHLVHADVNGRTVHDRFHSARPLRHRYQDGLLSFHALHLCQHGIFLYIFLLGTR